MHFTKEPILTRLPDSLAEALRRADLTDVEEIRMVANGPLYLIHGGGGRYLNEQGRSCQIEKALMIPRSLIEQCFVSLCDHSVYAKQDEIGQGFLTIEGGHRVGVCGACVLQDGKVQYIRDVQALNIRIARQIRGAAKEIMPEILDENGVHNTLIISPPGCGKTTMIRDIARILSDKGHYKVAIADERGEIAACYGGIAQNDVGNKTAVLSVCPKAVGMTMLLRSMGPDVIITDEIGTQEDKQAIAEILLCGVNVIATAHAKDETDVGEIKQGFSKMVVLGKNHTVEKVVQLC